MALTAVVGVTACDGGSDEAETGEVPEVAEIEAEPVEAQLELEEALPLTEEDVGEMMLVTGTVVGTVIPDGFFVATEQGRVLFVATTESVMPGEIVTATGPLQAATTLVFDEWETDALEGEVEADWDMLQTYYIEGQSVATPVTP